MHLDKLTEIQKKVADWKKYFNSKNDKKGAISLTLQKVHTNQ